MEQAMQNSLAEQEKKPLKGNLFKLMADARSKVRAVIALVLTLACLATAFAGWYVARSRDLFELPWVTALLKFVDEDAVSTRNSTSQTLADLATEYQDALNEYSVELQRELTPQEYETVVNYADVLRNSSQSLSIQNITDLTNGLDDLQQILISRGEVIPDDYQDSFNETNQEMITLNTVISVVNIVLLVVMILCMVLCLLGGTFRVRTLIIFSLLISLVLNVVMGGILMVLLTLVVHIALVVVLTQLRKICKASRT